MSATKIPYGKPVKLLVELQGYPDGRLVCYEVRRKTNSGVEKVAEINGVTKSNKALAYWNPNFLADVTFELQETPVAEKVDEKYYFIAKIDDKEIKSEDLEFTFPLTLFLEEGEEPVDGARFKVTFSDGTKSEGAFSKGFAKFKDAPLGEFTLEVEGYSPNILYGVLKRCTTFRKRVKPEVRYNVKLIVDEYEWARRGRPHIFLEKVKADGKTEIIFPPKPSPPAGSRAEPIDLLNIKGESKSRDDQSSICPCENLRLIEEDNTCDDGGGTRANCNKVLPIPLPLCVEVRKSVGAKSVRVKVGEVYAIFECIDNPEDTKIIEGPKHQGNSSSKNGKPFVEKFLKAIKDNQKSVTDDNCIADFGTIDIDRSRKLDNKVIASKICLRKSSSKPDPPDPLDRPASDLESLEELDANKNLAKLEISASSLGLVDPWSYKPEKDVLPGNETLFFCPPFVPGDDYTLKVTLVDSNGKNVLLEDENHKKVNDFQTPRITLWKKVRIHMVVRQDSASLNTLKWDEIKNAYHDAFLMVEEPEPRSKCIITVPPSQWADYLNRFVYKPSGHNTTEWQNFLKKKKWNDFNTYCFPQGSKLTPPDKAAATQKGWHSREQIAALARGIFAEKLASRYFGSVKWADYISICEGKEYGLCVLVCKPPAPNASFGGIYYWGEKMFCFFDEGDMSSSLTHEMGHALFLEHGATAFEKFKVSNTTSKVKNGIVMKRIGGGSSGPEFFDHDSEDMIPCVMSYYTNYYDRQGRKLAENAVDWHFCGVCLLKLRYYDTKKMAIGSNAIFRKLEYTNVKTIPSDTNKKLLTVACADEEYALDRDTDEPYISATVGGSISITEGQKREIFAVYPPESEPNNYGRTYYKDLSSFTEDRIGGNLDSARIEDTITIQRGEWTSSNQEIAMPEPYKPRAKGERIFRTILKAKKAGNTVIKFTIRISHTESFKSEPLNVKVVKPRKKGRSWLIKSLIAAAIVVGLVSLVIYLPRATATANSSTT